MSLSGCIALTGKQVNIIKFEKVIAEKGTAQGLANPEMSPRNFSFWQDLNCSLSERGEILHRFFEYSIEPGRKYFRYADRLSENQ